MNILEVPITEYIVVPRFKKLVLDGNNLGAVALDCFRAKLGKAIATMLTAKVQSDVVKATVENRW